MNSDVILVDVREDIRNGREPFSKIMNAASSLRNGQELLLLAPFKPVPLFGILAKQGFQHSARRQESGDWEVRFSRNCQVQPADTAVARAELDCSKSPTTGTTEILDVDARGLEPPLPLIKILETLSSLPPAAELQARTDRRPIHLYPQLEERGFAARTEEQTDGSFLTYISRR